MPLLRYKFMHTSCLHAWCRSDWSNQPGLAAVSPIRVSHAWKLLQQTPPCCLTGVFLACCESYLESYLEGGQECVGAQNPDSSVCNGLQSCMVSKGIPSYSSTRRRGRQAGLETSTASGQAAGCAGTHVRGQLSIEDVYVSMLQSRKGKATELSL